MLLKPVTTKMTKRNLIKESFKYNLKILQFCGLYSTETHKKAYKMYAWIFYAFFTFPVPSIGFLYLFFNKITSDNMEDIFDSIFMTAELGCFIVKFPPLIINASGVRNLVNSMNSKIFVETKHQATLDECVKTCKRDFRVYVVFVEISLFTWALKPFFQHGQNLPMKVWLPFSSEENYKFFIATYIFLFLGCSNGAHSNATLDTLISGLACHVAGQIRILKNNLENLENGPFLHKNIGQCIDHHNAILKFVKNFERCFSITIFSQFMAAMFVICLCCVDLTIVTPFSFNFFAMVMFTLTMLFQIFLYCYYGTTIFEESKGIITAVYLSKWYEFDVKSKKTLITLMERTKKPIIVKAGNVFDLSLETFVMILRKAYSLLAVLKNY